MRGWMLLLLSTVACGGSGGAPVVSNDVPLADPVEAHALDAADWEAMHGEVPSTPLGPATFTATAHTGEPRSQADLLGRPTVVWFYPAANTPG